MGRLGRSRAFVRNAGTRCEFANEKRNRRIEKDEIRREKKSKGRRGGPTRAIEANFRRVINVSQIELEACSGQGQVDRCRSGRWLLLRCVRTRRVPPGESSHSYKTDGLVAPRVSLGSRLACLECLAIARRARASERSDKGRGIVLNRANRDCGVPA